MHFLIKLKPASLRNAVIQYENRVDMSITEKVNHASCRNNKWSLMFVVQLIRYKPCAEGSDMSAVWEYVK